MSRLGIRVLGICLGLIGGTIVAVVSYSIRHRQSSNAILIPTDNAESLSDTEFAHGVGTQTDAPPADPGDRRRLDELKRAVASESQWTRSFALTERSGKTIRSEDLKGEPYVACFFYSTCPGTCKRQSGEMRLLQSKLKGKPIKLVSISVDPEVDTPEALSEYADLFGADKERWLFLTGNLDEIIKVGTEMFFLAGVEKRGHPDRFCLVDAQGELVGSYQWQESDDLEKLLQHIDELLASP